MTLPPPLSPGIGDILPPIPLQGDLVPRDALDLGEVPLLVAEGTDGPGPEPPLDAVQVEDVAAVPERDGEAVVVGGAGVGLVLDGGLVQGVPADGALGEWGRKSRREHMYWGQGRAGQGRGPPRCLGSAWGGSPRLNTL